VTWYWLCQFPCNRFYLGQIWPALDLPMIKLLLLRPTFQLFKLLLLRPYNHDILSKICIRIYEFILTALVDPPVFSSVFLIFSKTSFPMHFFVCIFLFFSRIEFLITTFTIIQFYGWHHICHVFIIFIACTFNIQTVFSFVNQICIFSMNCSSMNRLYML
jgi:hypothetical protein